MNRFLSVVSALGAMAVGVGASPVVASASTTTLNVPCGNITRLERAIGTPGATVNLAGGCSYHLTGNHVGVFGDSNQLPLVNSAITINGHGAVLSGASNTSGGRIMEVDQQGTLTLNSVTLMGGSIVSDFGGGGLFVYGGTTVLNSSVVRNNTARQASEPTGTDGGGILNLGGTLKVLNGSQVINNALPAIYGGGGGAGIGSFPFVTQATLIVSHSQVRGNTGASGGGGIAASGVVKIDNSTISGNKVVTFEGASSVGSGQGGGIVFGGGTLTLSNTLVAGNGIAFNPRSLGCTGCGTSDSQGGGIYIGGGSVTIKQSQMRNNTAATKDPLAVAEGGGLYNSGGSVTFSDSTVKGNTAQNNGGGSAGGGGIFNASGTVTLSTTTVNPNLPDNCEPTGTISGCT